jgi:hypothetical protein
MSFWRDLQEYEEEARMSYVTSVERIGFKRGLEQGEARLRQSLLDGIELGLQLRFGTPGLNLSPKT